MQLSWERDRPPLWDADKQRIVGGNAGLFDTLRATAAEALLPSDWWRAVRDGKTVGYGWMDVTWGDAEVLLAVDAGARRGGVGTFILDRLAQEAATQGVRYLYNVVPANADDPKALARWLEGRGFVAAGEGGVLRRPVRRDA